MTYCSKIVRNGLLEILDNYKQYSTKEERHKISLAYKSAHKEYLRIEHKPESTECVLYCQEKAIGYIRRHNL